MVLPGFKGRDFPYYLRVKLTVSVEVPALDVESTLSRPLYGDAGVVARTPAVEPTRRSSVRALLIVGERTDADAPPRRQW